MDSPIFAVDPAAGDDGWVVVLRRDQHGAWQVESSAGVDAADVVQQMVDAMPPPAYRPPAAGERPLSEQVAEWMREHAGTQFEWTAEQEYLVKAFYDRLADGHLTWSSLTAIGARP